jgi:glycosyltransferase involved in cell wall biosynthesis
MFPPTVRSGARQRTILFVGAWSLRKGCDVLLQAWRMLDGVRLVHVGPVGDLPLPTDAGFVHVDPVPQQMLSRHYAEADVFVLASREEGLALVQAQALGSGVPVVCTTRTGGVDLRDLLGCGDAVLEVPPDDAAALAAAIRRALDRVEATPAKGARNVVASLSPLAWRAYGERYDRQLRETVVSRRASPQ